MGALTMLNIVPAVFNIVTGVVVYGFAKIWYPVTTEGVTAVAHGAKRGMWLAFINHYGFGNAQYDLVERFLRRITAKSFCTLWWCHRLVFTITKMRGLCGHGFMQVTVGSRIQPSCLPA